MVLIERIFCLLQMLVIIDGMKPVKSELWLEKSLNAEKMEKFFRMLAAGIPQTIAVASAGITYEKWQEFRDTYPEKVEQGIRKMKGTKLDKALDDLEGHSPNDIRATALMARIYGSDVKPK